MISPSFNTEAKDQDLVPSFAMGGEEIGITVDIGGTNARFQLCGPSGLIDKPSFYKTNDFSSFHDVLARYMQDVPEAARATALALGAAGAVKDHTVKITNAAWPEISAAEIRTAFPALRHVCVVNDFVAIANGIASLRDSDRELIDGGVASPKGTVVIIGPGTGFGLATLVKDPHSGETAIVPGEAGHAPIFMPPAGRLRRVVETIETLGHPAYNRNVMTGRGMGLIYDALKGIETPALLDEMVAQRPVHPKTGAPDPHPHTDPAQVIDRARHNDPVAREAIKTFFTFLGRDAGTRAAAATATGGVYVAGGMVVRCQEAFAQADPSFWAELKTTLRRAADGYGPNNYSSGVRIGLILAEDMGLRGIANTFKFTANDSRQPERKFNFSVL